MYYYDCDSRYGFGGMAGPYAGYYEGAAAMPGGGGGGGAGGGGGGGLGFPQVRSYPEDWRGGYTQPEYPYDERDYEREVYRRDYDRRAPPT